MKSELLMKTTPRQTALMVLDRLDTRGRTLDLEFDQAWKQATHFTRTDRALLNALVYGVLRRRAYLDWIIGHFSKTRLEKIDPRVLNLLRLGLFQIIYLDKIPVSAAVDTSVEMAKAFAPLWVVRFVNAILRQSAKKYKAVPLPDKRQSPAHALAIEKSFPEWLVKRWLDRYGLDETASICEAVNTIPPVTVRTNTLKTTRSKLIQSLKGDVTHLAATPYALDGLYFTRPRAPIYKLEAFQKGWFQVQDEAAQLVATFLAPRPGEIILDACAGLGGKTGHMAQLMQNQGRIIAVDHNHKKLKKMVVEMKRLGISIVHPHGADLRSPHHPYPAPAFDRILLDAPCSGLGVLRRNPDIKWVREEQDLVEFKRLQLTFLNNLAQLVKPSGSLLFAVCSMEIEENEDVINNFLQSHPDFTLDTRVQNLPPQAEALIDKKGFLRTLPHQHHTDGFFAAALQKMG